MHSPAMYPEPMSRALRALSAIVQGLDDIREYIERDKYIELRSEMVKLYLDLYYVARVPYDHAKEPA